MPRATAVIVSSSLTRIRTTSSIRGTLRSFEDNNPGIDATELVGQFTDDDDDD